jgi:hypothetical protein
MKEWFGPMVVSLAEKSRIEQKGGEETGFTMACLAGPSFQEGRGSWARAIVAADASVSTAKSLRIT